MDRFATLEYMLFTEGRVGGQSCGELEPGECLALEAEVKRLRAEKAEMADAFEAYLDAIEHARGYIYDSSQWYRDGLDDAIDAAEHRFRAVPRD